MAATTTLRTSKIAKVIKADFPGLKFKEGANFYWSSSRATVVHKPIRREPDLWLLLHEIAHAKLKHANYDFDVHLAKYEAHAWELVKSTLAPKYNINPDIDFIEDILDTYRLWLHQRSLCPVCSQTGIQQNENTYSCLNCRCSWRVNEARLCSFRRKTLNGSFASAAN